MNAALVSFHVPVTVTSDIFFDYIVCIYMANDKQGNPLICMRDPMKRDQRLWRDATSIFQKLLSLIHTVKVKDKSWVDEIIVKKATLPTAEDQS